ncbi:hypothetical protein [Paenibacillus dendritiformis]|uniref:hypothetical protein n=1 Tax=Paenibacillus dendritiformis TaxID=130049 RepID=UPI0015EC37EA|nr:hypothetical protein [Paenibacillus dendritiformis]
MQFKVCTTEDIYRPKEKPPGRAVPDEDKLPRNTAVAGVLYVFYKYERELRGGATGLPAKTRSIVSFPCA